MIIKWANERSKRLPGFYCDYVFDRHQPPMGPHCPPIIIINIVVVVVVVVVGADIWITTSRVPIVWSWTFSQTIIDVWNVLWEYCYCSSIFLYYHRFFAVVLIFVFFNGNKKYTAFIAKIIWFEEMLEADVILKVMTVVIM